MSLSLARVVAVHPEDHSVDLVMIENGTRIAGVQVLTSSGTTDTGVHDMPTPSSAPSGDKWSLHEDKTRDMIAVVGSVGRNAVVIGFLFPQICGMLFKDENRRVMRHASDVYTSIDGAGNTEFFHPSGAYIRFGASAAHEDLTGKDVDGNWKITKNTGNQVHIHVQQAGNTASLDIAPNGAVSLVTQSTVNVTAAGNATVQAPNVTLDTPQATCTGKLTVQGLLTFQAGMSGSGGSGAAISGNVTVSGGEVSADGIGLKGHHHSDPQGGTVGPAV